MTQTSSPWDGLLLGDATNAPYSSAEWSHLWALMQGMGSLFPNYGVLLGTGGSTYGPVQPIASGSANVDVKPGAALVNGKLYETDAAVTLTVAANASGNPRIDTLVLRADYTAQTVRPVIKQGTPAASPVRPSLTQSSSLWEMPLADIAVANGFSSITQSDITDRRRYSQSAGAGWLPYAYPVGTNPYGDYASTFAIGANSGVAIPFAIAGNMLLDQLNILVFTTVSASIDWGVYVEDLNDGNATATSVRRIGGRVAPATTSLVSGSMIAIPATPPPIPLTPGAYWLIFTTSQNFSIGAQITTANRFNRDTPSFFTNGAPGAIGQTVNLGSGWSAPTSNDSALAIRLEGRIIDQVTAF